MSQNATRNAKGKSAKTALNTKQTQDTEDSLSATKNTGLPKDPSRLAEALKPTPEQIRLASILAVNNDSLENNRKVKQIIEVCPDLDEEQALMMLHEKDYDVNKVIEYVMEGGEISQNWKTAGTKPLKPKPSPNQTLEENQAVVSKAPVLKDEHRYKDRKQRPDRKPRQTNADSMSNGNNLEKRLESIDLNENDDENVPRQESRRGGGRGGFGGRGRGAARGSFRGRGPRGDRRETRRTQNETVDSKSYKKNADIGSNEIKVIKSGQIGTWSNEQAEKVDEFEIEEEWQGDLSKTQIFTASTQKKDIGETIEQSDFPIGHFNAEEATQNIKKAVGIGSIVSPRVTVTENCPATDQIDCKVKQSQIKIPPSAKPLPPPNTKIPKSAVIMPGGSTGNSINLDLQFGVDLDDQLVKTKNSTPQTVTQAGGKISNQSYAKNADSASNVQKAQTQPAPKTFAAQVQSQQQSQTGAPQPQRQQLQNKDSAAQILSISPKNKLPTNTNQQQPQQVLNQLQQIQTSHQTSSSVVNTNKTTTPNSNPIAPTTPGGTVPPPPGVSLLNPNNLVNPNNPYLIGLPFTQIDTNLLQMYSHLANMPPPGVGGPNAQSAPQYPISDTKFARNEVTSSNTALNSSNPGNVSGQLNQPQQQQPPINLIPNLNNYPFFFPNYPYHNFLMQIPNGSQTTPGAPNQPPQPPFGNKPAYNFSNNPEDYTNYPAQANSQMKNSNSNLSNVNDMTTQSYSKADKAQPGYHAPTPPNNFSNQLLSQQTQQGQHQNLGNNQSGPQPMGYMTSMMGSHAGNMVHPGIQDNLNRSSSSNIKQKYAWNH